MDDDKTCSYCHANSTPMWRHGPGIYTNLCNSCGVKWRRGKILSQGTFEKNCKKNDNGRSISTSFIKKEIQRHKK